MSNLDLTLEDNITDEELSDSILDFFQNEYYPIALDLLPIFTRTAGPDNNKLFLKEVFCISQEENKKGIIQKRLKKISQNPPQNYHQIEEEIDFFVDLNNQVLEAMADLIYSMDEWLESYRKKAEKGQLQSQLQIYAINNVVEDFHIINQYIKEKHNLVFQTIISILEQKKGSFN